MMKKYITGLGLMLSVITVAQRPGYYNGTEGKSGDALKTALYEIINAHVDFSYSDAKYILNYADADPNNENNLILFYTKRSQSNTTWGSAGNDINREHVWAKSHGDFQNIRPMDGDAYNLHPSDASVNILKSNYDFDFCSENGTYISEADAYYTSNQFEPSDAAKGEVARTIFYMATRYEGENGELDLKVVDLVGTYPKPEHGKLSTLLKWNRDFPPTDLERRRNERVSEAQNNRNPFIDHPEFADLIWGGKSIPGITIGELEMEEEYPLANTYTKLRAVITGNTSAMLYYGLTRDSEEMSKTMSQSAEIWSADFDLSGFNEQDLVHFKIEATDGSETAVTRGTYRIPADLTLTEIRDVQGTGATSPLVNSTVTIGGIVTANFDNTYYMQNGTDPGNGMCVFDIRRGNIGDSVIVTGKVAEYNGLTELAEVSYTYVYNREDQIVPKVISISEVGEEYEGMLVTFNNVTFLQGDTPIPLKEAMTLTFTDGTNDMTVYSRYNSRLGGNTVPSGTVNVTGVVSQYQSNYQILINSINDITAGDDDEAPLLTSVTVNDASWIELSFSEKISKSTAENISNYTITDGVTIDGAYLYNDTKVLLLVSGLMEQDYTVTVRNVADLNGNSITETSLIFHSDYSSVGFENSEYDEIRIYPDLSGNILHLDMNRQFSNTVIQLYSATGQLMLEKRIDYPSIVQDIDISYLHSGIYVIRIADGNSDFRKIISLVK